MLKRIVLCLLLLSNIIVANAQTKTTNYYQKVFYNDSSIISFKSLVANPDGTNVILGSYQNNTNNGDILLMKTDTLGNVIWTSVVGNDSIEGGQAIAKTLDGGYVVAGDIIDPRTFSGAKMEVTKVDANGELKWSAIFGGKEGNQTDGVSVLGNGKILVAGRGIKDGEGFNSGYTLALDANGTPDDGRYYKKGSFNTFLSSARETTDGGIVLSGSNWASFSSPSFFDPWLVKLDSKGDTAWAKTYVMPNTQISYLMRVTPTGDFIMSGQFAVGDTAGTFIMKTNAKGDFKWCKGFRAFASVDPKFFQRVYDIAPVRDGYVAAGSIKDGTKDSIQIKSVFSGKDTIIITDRFKPFLLKTDTAGNVLWSRVYADSSAFNYLGSKNSEVFGIVPTFDGGYTLVGSTFNYGAKRGGGLLIHVDKDGYIGSQNSCNVTNPITWNVRNFVATESTGALITESGDENSVKLRKTTLPHKRNDLCSAKGTYTPTSLKDELLPESAVKIYPNPTRDELFVELLTSKKAQTKVTIFDLTGRIVHIEKTNSDVLRIDTPQYARGIYFVRVEQDGRFLTKKIVVQ